MWAMRSLYGALASLVLIVIVLVVWSSLGVGGAFLVRVAVLGLVSLSLAAGVFAIFDSTMARWQRILAICVGALVPLAAVLLFVAFVLALSQLTG